MNDSDQPVESSRPPRLPASIYPGQMRPRWERLAKNTRWYLVRRATITKVGWGDLSVRDLADVAEHLGGREALVVLPEKPRPHGQHLPHEGTQDGWCWYDRPDCGATPTAAVLAAAAVFAVVNNTVRYVTPPGSAHPPGDAWVRSGYSYNADGHDISAPMVRYPGIRPEDLNAQLVRLVGPDGPRA